LPLRAEVMARRGLFSEGCCLDHRGGGRREHTAPVHDPDLAFEFWAEGANNGAT